MADRMLQDVVGVKCHKLYIGLSLEELVKRVKTSSAEISDWKSLAD